MMARKYRNFLESVADPTAQVTGLKRGFKLSDHVARKLVREYQSAIKAEVEVKVKTSAEVKPKEVKKKVYRTPSNF